LYFIPVNKIGIAVLSNNGCSLTYERQLALINDSVARYYTAP